ncbi:MAG TPA: DUF481 domain-containing protein [Candidatus Sulfotelmatobacter sp.]|nr:DUF481 domain-containing protein [Candidatus Sulfotelmatobacter sp.]
MLRKFQVCALTALFGFSTALFADQVTLKNGDRLTGTVVKSDGKTLVIHTDAAGDVELKYDDIDSIKTDQELYVAAKGGKTAVGPVTTTNGNLVVESKGGNVEVQKDQVTSIRNDAEQAKLNPGLMHGWDGGINLGFSIARGNSETENLALAFNAEHPREHDKLMLYASSINTTNGLATPSTVASLTQGGFRYDRDLNPRIFAFGEADFMANALQYLDLRQVYSGGFGYHAIKNDSTTLDFLGGLNYTHETYSNGALVAPGPPPIYASYGVTNRFVALTLGDEWDQKVGKSTTFIQTLGFFPDLQNTGEYRFTFNFGTVTKINKWLGWQNQFGDIYVTNPPLTAKKNDLIFTTGLNIAFGTASK